MSLLITDVTWLFYLDLLCIFFAYLAFADMLFRVASYALSDLRHWLTRRRSEKNAVRRLATYWQEDVDEDLRKLKDRLDAVALSISQPSPLPDPAPAPNPTPFKKKKFYTH